MKEDEKAEHEMDLEELEQLPITSEKITETVKKLEKRLEHDLKNKPLKKVETSVRKGSSTSKTKVRGTKDNIWRTK